MANASYDTSVKINGNGSNSGSFPALTTASPNEGLLACLHVSNATPSAMTFTSGGLSWSAISGTPITIPTAGGEFYLYYALAASIQSAVTFNFDITGGGFPQWTALLVAYKDIDPLGFIGATTTNSTGSNTTLSASITTTAANSLVIAFGGETANQLLGAGTGQTEDNEDASAGGFSRANVIRQNAVTAAVGTSVTMDVTAASAAAYAMFVVEIKSNPNPLMSINTKNRGIRPRPFAPGLAR